jgi:phosphomannomutase/phosphoglucomutase
MDTSRRRKNFSENSQGSEKFFMREAPEVFKKYDIRGKVPEELDGELVFELGKCLGKFWKSGKICVGRDARESSPDFYKKMISGLKAEGCEVTKLGIATTDMVALAAKKKFDGGVMITASHMPPSFGGFKPLNSEGRILSNDEMAAVKETYVMEEVAGEEEKGESLEEEFTEKYRKRILERYRELFDREPEDLKVVIDSSNSVGKLAAGKILEELGAEVVEINAELDPEFPAHSPEPDEESAQQLSEKVVKEEADFGIIFDGDADRVMFIDENGKFISGDTALGIFAEKYLEFSEKIVLSINTSSEVQEFVRNSGGEITHTPPGAVFTALRCLEHDAVFGGQPNGHLMDTEFVPYDSGTLFGVLLAGIMVEKNQKLSDIRKKFEELEKEKFDLETSKKNEKMLEIREKARDRNLIKSERFNSLNLSFKGLNVLLRPSGSEDVIRVRIEAEEVSEKDVEAVKSFLEE